MTDYGIPVATIERAAEAIRQEDSSYCETECELCVKRSERVVRAALSVIGPKIREAVVREMMAEFEGNDGLAIQTTTEADDGTFAYEYVTLDSREALAYLRTYLPAADVPESEGDDERS